MCEVEAEAEAEAMLDIGWDVTVQLEVELSIEADVGGAEVEENVAVGAKMGLDCSFIRYTTVVGPRLSAILAAEECQKQRKSLTRTHAHIHTHTHTPTHTHTQAHTHNQLIKQNKSK